MTYDLKMKFNAVARYESGGVSLRSLSQELGIPWSTIAGWVHKSRAAKRLSPIAKAPLPLVDITAEVRPAPKQIPAGPITISINGVDISTDSMGVKAIIEAIRQ
jgi:transposase-like protein